MLHVGMLLYNLKAGQHISEKAQERLDKYLEDESRLFVRYSSIESILCNSLPNYKGNYGNEAAEFKNIICLLRDIFDMEMTSESQKFDPYFIIQHVMQYVHLLSQPEYADNLEHLIGAISEYKEQFTKTSIYSYGEVEAILKKKEITLDDWIHIMKSLYFAYDNLNIKSVLYLRKYLIKNFKSDKYVHFSKLKDNPGNNLLGMIFSDSVIFTDIISYYDYMCYADLDKYDFSVIINNNLSNDNVELLLVVAYLRYLIGIYIFIIQCDYSSFFDGKNIEIWLLRIYRRFGFMLFTSIYKYFTIQDVTLCISMLILDDICTYTPTLYTRNRLDNARALASALSRDTATEDYSKIIDEICNKSLELWNKGSELGHIDMINSFKDSKNIRIISLNAGLKDNLPIKLSKYAMKIIFHG